MAPWIAVINAFRNLHQFYGLNFSCIARLLERVVSTYIPMFRPCLCSLNILTIILSRIRPAENLTRGTHGIY
jgi:hypothetical protein